MNIRAHKAVGNWLDDTVESHRRDTQETDRRPLTEKADPLALSWASYGVWQKLPAHRWAPWNDLEAAPHDHDMAKATRQYYKNKIGLELLRGSGTMSQVRRDIYDICTGGIMRECHRGLLYRMPYFYVEDLSMERLRGMTTAQPELQDLPTGTKITRDLVPYDRIFHSRRRAEIMKYWFHDRDTGYAVAWPVAYDNPLRSVVDAWFDQSRVHRVRAHWNVARSTRDKWSSWYVVAPEIVFD